MQNQIVSPVVAWQEEITKETEHYYQGEQRQEERASWLLATTCAIVAIYTSGLFLFVSDNSLTLNAFQITLLLIMFGFLFLSSLLALLGIIPLSGHSLPNPFTNCKYYKNRKGLSPNDFCKITFDSEDMSEQDRVKWQLNHFHKHYLRNLKKSILVIWSSIFFGLGLVVGLVNTIFLIIAS